MPIVYPNNHYNQYNDLIFFFPFNVKFKVY